jgi:hypothetical protein
MKVGGGGGGVGVGGGGGKSYGNEREKVCTVIEVYVYSITSKYNVYIYYVHSGVFYHMT